MKDLTDQELQTLLNARFEQSMSLPLSFLSSQAEQIAAACWAMARRFHQGGRLLAFGTGAFATDAQHVSVEFVHPVVVGKRALPAIALTNENTILSRSPDDCSSRGSVAQQLKLLARKQDIALGFVPDGACQSVVEALGTAKRMELLTIGLAGDESKLLQRCAVDFCFAVPSRDLCAIQETHETLYHVLWELVHVFFEHEGLLQ